MNKYNKLILAFTILYSSISFSSSQSSKLKEVSTQNNNQTIVNSQCTKENCSINGSCINQNQCLCNPGFTFISSIPSNELCNYGLKLQITAFMLEFFLFLGFGHLYCGRYANFIIKFLVFVSFVILDFIMKYAIKVKSYKSKKSIHISSYIFYGIMILWQCVDVILFGLNVYTDYYGLKLMPFNS